MITTDNMEDMVTPALAADMAVRALAAAMEAATAAMEATAVTMIMEVMEADAAAMAGLGRAEAEWARASGPQVFQVRALLKD